MLPRAQRCWPAPHPVSPDDVEQNTGSSEQLFSWSISWRFWQLATCKISISKHRDTGTLTVPRNESQHLQVEAAGELVQHAVLQCCCATEVQKLQEQTNMLGLMTWVCGVRPMRTSTDISLQLTAASYSAPSRCFPPYPFQEMLLRLRSQHLTLTVVCQPDLQAEQRQKVAGAFGCDRCLLQPQLPHRRGPPPPLLLRYGLPCVIRTEVSI